MVAFRGFFAEFVQIGFLNSGICFAVCIALLLGEVRRELRNIISLAFQAALAFSAEVILSYVAFLWTGSVSDIGAWGMAIHVLEAACFTLIFSRLSWQGKLVRCVTFVAAYQLLMGLVGSFGPAFGEALTTAAGIRTNLTMDLACFLWVAFIRRYSTEGFRFIPGSYVILVCMIGVLALFCTSSLMAMVHPYEMSGPLGIFAFEVYAVFLVLAMASYALFYAAAKEHEEREDALLLQKAMADDGDQLAVARDVYESLREARHEIKNHDAYMRTLLDAGDYEGLRAYFNQYEHSHEGLAVYVQSGQRTVDAVVNTSIAKARSQGVEIRIMLAVPSHLGYDPADLYSLLANLLDNAIEGTMASGSDERVVRMSFLPKGGYYVINVTNPVNPRMRPGKYATLATTKHDALLHGWGTRVIEKVAESYGGVAEFTVKDGHFIANIMLERKDQHHHGENGGTQCNGGI
jgi:hypothetical protein